MTVTRRVTVKLFGLDVMFSQNSPEFLSALDDFRRARRQADLKEMLARLTGKSASLLSYEEVRRQLRAVKTGRSVLKEIPLDAIVGSVGRYNDFTRDFLPKSDSDRDRWARVKLAMADWSGVPPIEVYQIGQAYFVLDGNHRVSAARQLGMTHIPAYVTEVKTRVELSPDDQPDDLIIKAEYAEFLERTRLDLLRPGADLTVTAPGQYRILEEYIETHRYFMGLEQKREIPYEEAVAHWYDTVYLPVVQVIRARGVLLDFPGRTEADLYLWLAEHRAALEEALGWELRPEAVADDLVKRFSPRLHHVVTRIGEKIRRMVMPEEIEGGPPPGQWREERLTGRQTDRLFTDILIALDGKESGWWAMEQAAIMARREEARLHAFHVLASPREKESRAARALESEFRRRCEALGVAGDLVFEVGNVSRQACALARWTDLVVLGLKHPPAPRVMARLGSGISALIRSCPRLILMVPAPPHPLERALLAYDGSPKADEALFVATYMAARWNIPLVVMTVLEEGRTTPETLARARLYLEMHGLEATCLVERGPVAASVMLTAEEQDCDLILMGGYGLSPVLGIVAGSAVDEVLRTSRRPVLVCR